MGKAEGRKEAQRMLSNPNRPRTNIRMIAGNFFDTIDDIIRHTTEYNMDPYLQNISKDKILDKVESEITPEKGNNYITEICNTIVTEIGSNLLDEDLEYEATVNLEQFNTAISFHSKQAINKRDVELKQYNPNNSITDLAVMLKEQTKNPKQKFGKNTRSDMMDKIAISLNRHSGIPIDRARSIIGIYYTDLTVSSLESKLHPSRRSVSGSNGDQIMSRFSELSKDNKGLIELINNSSPEMKKMGIAALVAQSDSVNLLDVEERENSFYTGSQYLVKLLKELPQMPINELQVLFPDSFGPDRSAEKSRKILILNSKANIKEWEVLSKVSSYTRDVEHRIIDHSNIITNIQKEIYGYSSILFPELNKHIEYLDKRAEEVNSRKSTSVRILGNLTKDYFLDALSIMKAGAKGTSKLALNKALKTRVLLNGGQSVLATYNKSKREGKSFKQINEEARKEMAIQLGISGASHAVGIK